MHLEVRRLRLKADAQIRFWICDRVRAHDGAQPAAGELQTGRSCVREVLSFGGLPILPHVNTQSATQNDPDRARPRPPRPVDYSCHPPPLVLTAGAGSCGNVWMVKLSCLWHRTFFFWFFCFCYLKPLSRFGMVVKDRPRPLSQNKSRCQIFHPCAHWSPEDGENI